MALLITGLLLFIGGHSINLFAPDWRQRMISRIGLLPWKGIYSLIAAAGLILMVIGYGDARLNATWLWTPPVWARHLALVITLPATLLLFASQIPGNHIQVTTGHPMYLGIKLWAFAHLLANGGLHDLIMFGVFLAWGVAGFVISRRRDRAAGVVRDYKDPVRDILTIVISLGVWLALILGLHQWITGMSPLG